MFTAAAESEAVYCVGRKEEYVSLLHDVQKTSLEGRHLFYLGGKFADETFIPRRVLLMNLDIDNIAYCITRNIPSLSFVYNGHIITEESQQAMLQPLERECLNRGDYAPLKQINMIRLVFDIRRKATVLSARPLHLQIEHTTFCNAKCIMCDHYIAHNRGSKHLGVSTVRALESLFPYVSLVVMHGNGEPLLNPDILKIFELYQKYRIKTSLNTNLSYLNEEILGAIRENCASIHVSCDGSSADQYESIRQGLSYETFLTNLKKLSVDCPKVEKVMEVVLMRQNIRNAEAFVRLAYEYGFGKVIFNALGCNEWIGNNRDDPFRYSRTAFYHCSLAKELGQKLGILVVTPFDDVRAAGQDDFDIEATYPPAEPSDLLHEKYGWYTNTLAFKKLQPGDVLDLDPGKPSNRYTGLCEYPFAKSYIDLEGRVSFCCPASRKIVDKISHEKHFDKIWNGREYQTLRETFYRGDLPSLCRDCYFIRNHSLKFLSVT